MSENNAIQFELVSPEEKLVSEGVFHAVVPGTDGEFGVGAGHSSFVVALKPGVVRLYKESLSEKPRRIFIAGGFADITGENCTVLAEQAVNIEDLDQAAVEQEIRDLEEDLSMAADEAARARIAKKVVQAKAKLEALTGHIVL